VVIGRGKIGIALVLALAIVGTAAIGPQSAVAKKKVKVVFFKARVSSDGFLTPGQPETVAVSHLPEKARFKMAIEPPPITLQCGQLYFCDVAPVAAAPGGPPFRTNRKGAAVVTFVMPQTYNVAVDPFDPATRHPVNWANGQRIHIDVECIKRLPHKRKIGFGFGRAAVATP
jgi:hypothetical protein